MAILGPAEALASLWRGFSQILGGALDPLGKGSDNVRALGQLLATAPFLTCAAVLSIKATAFNLLPVPPLNGFQILQSAALPDAGRSSLDWAVNIGVMALILILGSYGLAFGVVLWFS
jgi:membrane-associated protease RseP (regulator of RpoE activity)